MRSLRWVLSMTLVCAGGAGAQPDIQVIGNARGCFGAACAPVETAQASVGGVPLLSYASLAFPAVDFSGLAAAGLLVVSGANGNFGTITIAPVVGDYDVSMPFGLALEFSSPLAGVVFAGQITGMVSPSPFVPEPTLLFAPASLSVPFTNPAPGGYPGFLTVTVDPVTLTPGGTTPITGSVAVTFVTPEPATLALSGAGLAAVAAAAGARRRRR